VETLESVENPKEIRKVKDEDNEARALYKRLWGIHEKIKNGTADNEERGFFYDEMLNLIRITEAEVVEAYQRVQAREDWDGAEKQWHRYTITMLFRGDAPVVPETIRDAQNPAAERILFVLDHPGMRAES